MFSLQRESYAIGEYRVLHPSVLAGSQIKLPKWNGHQLPDIDMLLRNEEGKHLVVAELKWQLGASSTREVVSRNEYLKKGYSQLLKIRDFLSANPNYLRDRNLSEHSIDNIALSYLLLCRGHLGSEAIMSDEGILMCDNAVFLDSLGKGLDNALDVARSFSYLPVEGKDFLLKTLKVRFGASTVSWKAMLPTSLTEDTETGFVEDYYMDGARFAVP